MKQAFPSLCIETFKIILDIGPKTYTKLINSCLELIIFCFEKLFNEKIYGQRKEDPNKNIIKIAQMFLNVKKDEHAESNKPEDKVKI